MDAVLSTTKGHEDPLLYPPPRAGEERGGGSRLSRRQFFAFSIQQDIQLLPG
jgi:hypothetical protein